MKPKYVITVNFIIYIVWHLCIVTTGTFTNSSDSSVTSGRYSIPLVVLTVRHSACRFHRQRHFRSLLHSACSSRCQCRSACIISVFRPLSHSYSIPSVVCHCRFRPLFHSVCSCHCRFQPLFLYVYSCHCRRHFGPNSIPLVVLAVCHSACSSRCLSFRM